MLYNANCTISSSEKKFLLSNSRSNKEVLHTSSTQSSASKDSSGIRTFRLKGTLKKSLQNTPRQVLLDASTADQFFSTTHMGFIAAPMTESNQSKDQENSSHNSSKFFKGSRMANTVTNRYAIPESYPNKQASKSPNGMKSFTPFTTILQSNQSWCKFARTNLDDSCVRDVMRNQLSFNQTQKICLIDTVFKEQSKQFGSTMEAFRQHEQRFNLPNIKIKMHQDALLAKQETKKSHSQTQPEQQMSNNQFFGQNKEDDAEGGTAGNDEDENKITNERKLGTIKVYWYCITDSSWRPETREFPSLVYQNGKLIMYGGMGNEMYNKFNVFDFTTWKWRVLESAAQLPEGRFGHSAHLYKKDMVIFGGEKKFNSHLKMRSCYNDVQVYSFAQNTWNQIRTFGDTIENRRNHASLILSKFLFIYGGINSYNQLLSDFSSVNLESFKCNNLPLENGGDSKGIAFHTITAVFKGEVKIESPHFTMEVKKGKEKKFRKVKEEGLYVFGGLQANNEASNQLKILKLGQLPFRWVYPETKGIPPLARYQHSCNYFEDGNILIIYGGRNESRKLQRSSSISSNGIMSDVCILDIESLTWTRVEENGLRSIYKCAFSSCLIDSKLITFGGYGENGYANSDIFILEIDPSKNRRILSSAINPLTKANPKNVIQVSDILEEHIDIFDMFGDSRNNHMKQLKFNEATITEIIPEEDYIMNMKSYQPVPNFAKRKTIKQTGNIILNLDNINGSAEKSKFKVNENGIPSLQAISETESDTDLAIQQQLHIKINQLKKKNNNSSSKAVSMAKLL